MPNDESVLVAPPSVLFATTDPVRRRDGTNETNERKNERTNERIDFLEPKIQTFRYQDQKMLMPGPGQEDLVHQNR